MTEQEMKWREVREKMLEGNLLAQAENGDAEAQRYMGDCYYYGCGVEQKRTEAFRWYHLAAEQGDTEAQRFLGIYYLWGSPGIVRNAQTAMKWLHLAAEQGVADAQVELGDCYALGQVVEADFEEALKWYRRAGLPEDDKRIKKIKGS